eukprot:869556-Amphidinium_carterae.2
MRRSCNLTNKHHSVSKLDLTVTQYAIWNVTKATMIRPSDLGHPLAPRQTQHALPSTGVATANSYKEMSHDGWTKTNWGTRCTQKTRLATRHRRVC